MKTAYTLIAAFTLATTGAAFAADNSEAATAAASASTATAASAVVTQQAPKKPQGLTRAEVQAQVTAARKNGTLIETEADMDVAQTRRQYAQ